MMEKNLTKRQMINAELAARNRNTKAAKILDHHIPAEEKEGLKIEFQCECADPTCQAYIPLTLQEYDDLHTNVARFVVAKDHVVPAIERVQKTTAKLSVVDKYALA